ncbi:MAG: hypothetical protein QW803_09080 [Candidatus Methanomethylicia archaeon]
MKTLYITVAILVLLLLACYNSSVCFGSTDEWEFNIKIEYTFRDLVTGIQVVIDAGTEYEQHLMIKNNEGITVNLKTGIHSVYIENVFYISNNSRCEFQYWLLNGCGRTWHKDNPIIIVIPRDKELKAYFTLKHKLKIETTPVSQSLLIDGETSNTPFETWLTERYVVLSAPENFKYNGITYTFKSWIDNYNQTYLTNTVKIYMNKPVHITATYYTTNTTCNLRIIAIDEFGGSLKNINVSIDDIYKLKTNSHGVCEILIIGGMHNIAIQEIIEFTSNDTRIQFYMWNNKCLNSTCTLNLTGNITLIAMYKYYYKLRVKAFGFRENIEFSIFINNEKLKLNSKEEIASWICKDHMLNISFPDIIYLNDEVRYVLKEITTSSGYRYESQPLLYTLTIPTSIHVHYQTQYLVQVISNYSKPYGYGWYDEGKTAHIGLNSDIHYYNQSVRYVFERWSGDLSTSDLSLVINVDKPKRIIALWNRQYCVSLIFKNLHGTSIINPEFITIIFQNNTRVSISNFNNLWLNSGLINFECIVWAGGNVHLNRTSIEVNKTGIIEIPCIVGDLIIKVVDVFGNPADNTEIIVTPPNSSKLIFYTDDNGYVYVHNIHLSNLNINARHLLQNINLNIKYGLDVVNIVILLSRGTMIEIIKIFLAFIFILIILAVFRKAFRSVNNKLE